MPIKNKLFQWIMLLSLGLGVLILLGLHLERTGMAVYDNYKPVNSDEIDYVKSTEYFVKNHSPKAFSTFDEIYARAGEYSFHGPSYPVIFGLPQLLTASYSPYFILYANIALSFFVLLIVMTWKEMGLNNRLLTLGIILTSPVFVVYSITYMMEMFQITVAILFARYFRFLLANPYIFVPLSLILGITRQSNLFFAIPTAFGKGRVKQFFVFGAFLFISLVAMFYLMGQFNAPFPGGAFANISACIVKGDFMCALTLASLNFSANIIEFFSLYNQDIYHTIARYLVLLATFYALIVGWLKKERLLLSAGLVGLAFLAALFIFYDTFGWRELRSLAGVYLFLVAIIAVRGHRTILTVIFIAQLIAFPSLITYRASFTQSYAQRFLEKERTETGVAEDFQMLRQLELPDSKNEFVLVSIENGLFSTSMSVEMYHIPIQNNWGNPLRYTFEWLKEPGQGTAIYRMQKQPCEAGQLALQTSSFNVCSTPR